MALYIVAERHRDEWLIVPLGMHVGDDSGSFPACLLPDMEPEYGVGAQSEGSGRNKLFPVEEDVCGG